MGENTAKNTPDGLIPWKKGDPSPNPNGRPKGQRNYATIYREALLRLAEKNNLEPDQLETELLEKAIFSARKGDYRFFKDIMDRLYGTATQKHDHTSDGDKINFVLAESIVNKNAINTETESDSE